MAQEKADSDQVRRQNRALVLNALRRIGQVDIGDVEIDVLVFQRDHGALNEGAGLEADQV